VQVAWKEYPMTANQLKDFEDYFAMLGIQYTQLAASMFGPKIKKRFSCYICSRNRKRILFYYAGKVGANKIAFGHHIDDIVQTTLMNMTYGGQLATMMPKQSFFNGQLEVIRPMCQCREKQVLAIAQQYNLPIISIACPYRDESGRMAIKPIIEQLERVQPGAKENMYKDLFNIKANYLPGLVYGEDNA
jgi:tRNA 2-thiocytidine biosynthesis protein TtcA